jgi:hypothetical protein
MVLQGKPGKYVAGRSRAVPLQKVTLQSTELARLAKKGPGTKPDRLAIQGTVKRQKADRRRVVR